MKRLKRWQKVLLTLLGVLLVGLFFLDRWLRPYDLETERALARAAGVPLTIEDLKLPVPSADQDAGPLYDRLGELRKARPLDEALEKKTGMRLWPGGPSTPAALDAMRRLVASDPGYARVVHDAAARPYAYLPHSWQIPADNFPKMARIREAVKWLRWEGLALAHEGRYDEAVAALSLGFRCADHASQDPTLISLLVSIACEALVVSGLQDVLLMAGPNERVSRSVEKALAGNPLRKHYARFIGGETVLGQEASWHMFSVGDVGKASADGPAPPRTGRPGFLARRYMVGPWNAVHLHYMRQLAEAARLAPPERRSAMKAVEKELESHPRFHPAFVLTRILAPVFTKSETRVTMADAQRSVLFAAARVMGFKARTGRWPVTLSVAAPDTPTDPFTGKPIGYRVEEKGFVVYSAGERGDFLARLQDLPKGQAFFRYPPAPPRMPGAPPGVGPTNIGPTPSSPMPGGPGPGVPANPSEP